MGEASMSQAAAPILAPTQPTSRALHRIDVDAAADAAWMLVALQARSSPGTCP